MKIRTFLLTTSLLAGLSTSAIAATQTGDASLSGQMLASNLMGATVYNSAADSGETLGEVSDIVISDDARVDAVIVDVGGFLGMGEKRVALNYDSLAWQRDADGDAVLVISTTKDQIEKLPVFGATDAVDPDADPAATAPSATAPVTPADETAALAPPAAPAPGADTAAMADPASRPLIDASKISADQLLNTTVYGADNTNVGEIGDVLLSADGKVDAVVIDVGGFLGIGEKPVAIAFSDFTIAEDQNGSLLLQTAFTREQLDAAPTYDEAAYRANPGNAVLRSRG